MTDSKVMTIEELKQYKHLKNEVAFWQRELAKELQRSYTQSPRLTGLPKADMLMDPTARRAIETDELVSMIELLQRRADKKLREIVTYIKDVEDPLIRAILYGRYIKGMTWYQLADAVGGGNTADSLRKMHNRYFRRA